jgi:hypothetical protein
MVGKSGRDNLWTDQKMAELSYSPGSMDNLKASQLMCFRRKQLQHGGGLSHWPVKSTGVGRSARVDLLDAYSTRTLG